MVEAQILDHACNELSVGCCRIVWHLLLLELVSEIQRIGAERVGWRTHEAHHALLLLLLLLIVRSKTLRGVW